MSMTARSSITPAACASMVEQKLPSFINHGPSANTPFITRSSTSWIFCRSKPSKISDLPKDRESVISSWTTTVPTEQHKISRRFCGGTYTKTGTLMYGIFPNHCLFELSLQQACSKGLRFQYLVLAEDFTGINQFSLSKIPTSRFIEPCTCRFAHPPGFGRPDPRE